MSDIVTMPAGREMDALVAERVMGWSGRTLVRRRGSKDYLTVFRHAPGAPLGDFSVFYTEDGTKLYCGEPWTPSHVPRYSADIDVAWKVVERMRERETASTDDAFRLAWDRAIRGVLGMAQFYSAQEVAAAICRAALAAVEAQS